MSAVPPLVDEHVPVEPIPVLSLSDIGQLRDAGRVLFVALENAVRRHRLLGASWAQVGQALGISRQAAWERFKYLDGETLQLVVGGGEPARLVVGGVQGQVVFSRRDLATPPSLALEGSRLRALSPALSS